VLACRHKAEEATEVTNLRPTLVFAGVLPKRGHSPSECEDAVQTRETCFAVSDGASEAVYSGWWAKRLTEEFCVCDRSETIEFNAVSEWFEKCRSDWVQWRLEKEEQPDLPWFTREKLIQGSYATFLGTGFSTSRPRCRWTAWAYGDTCLFQVKNDATFLSFPLERSEQFGNTPALVGTNGAQAVSRFTALSGLADAGDRFYLATDALARWFLSTSEKGLRPWNFLEAVASPETFQDFVHAARDSGEMHNDDVALIVIEIQ
jgi:hypothetical protein